ncbi:MAG: APC family permease [Actinomycetota bacterium]
MTDWPGDATGRKIGAMNLKEREEHFLRQAAATVGIGQALKRVILGRKLATEEAGHQLLRKALALPVFSSDALSSVAYATEEIMLVLVLAGAAQLRYVRPLAIGIAALLIVVVTSYRQTVRAYPQGGGSYIVTHSNLGEIPGLIAAAALLVDYVLTVAVSVVAGAAAIVSAVPGTAKYRLVFAVSFIIVITLMNLRGTKESGTVFAIPTYTFIVLVFIMIGTGLVKCVGGCPVAQTANLEIRALQPLGIFILLRAFASGATALTGVEAIADGVAAFRRPQSKNAAATLAIMGTISVSMFLGISFLAHALKIRPITEKMVESGVHPQTVVAQIAQTVFGRGFLFFLVQTATALILILAANTAYQDFPRLSSILARDRYMPRQFLNRGDRLVFSNGIVVLAFLASMLVVIFDADLTRLIQLYVVGVFTSFTLSQTGMVRRWFSTREPKWRRSALINGIAAVVTGIVLVVVTLTKFVHGAYIVVAAIPVIVAGFKAVNRHYQSVAKQLRVPGQRPKHATGARVIILVESVTHVTLRAVGYALSLRPTDLRALHVGNDGPEIQEQWRQLGIRSPLTSIPMENDLAQTTRSYIRQIDLPENEFLSVIIPERLPERSWLSMVRQRRLLLLKASLLFEPRVVVTDLPQVAGEEAAPLERPEVPPRNIGVVLVSAVHNATLRAIAYAQAIHPLDLRAVSFAVDAKDTAQIMDEWIEAGVPVPLEILDSPFREVRKPLVRFIRSLRADRPDATVTVILPEFVVSKWWHQFMHNQTALRIKATLLYEPGVVVTSVPFHLD